MKIIVYLESEWSEVVSYTFPFVFPYHRTVLRTLNIIKIINKFYFYDLYDLTHTTRSLKRKEETIFGTKQNYLVRKQNLLWDLWLAYPNNECLRLATT